MARPRIIFAGTPEFAATILEQLIASDLKPVAVYTQPDRPAGRGKKLQPSATKAVALTHDIPVQQPLDLKSSDNLAQLESYQADLMIVVAYGLLLPEAALTTPRLGCINVHASLLPRWRGAAPIQRAIAAGDETTGVAIMQMDKGLDTGPVWHSESLLIDNNDTAASLHDKLAALGAEALLKTLPKIFEQQSNPTPQSQEGVTYAHKLVKSEAEIDWQESATTIARKVRAFNSWPVAYFNVDGQPVRVWQAHAIEQSTDLAPGCVIAANREHILIACAEGVLALEELQPAGSRRMSVADLLNARQHWFVSGQAIGAG